MGATDRLRTNRPDVPSPDDVRSHLAEVISEVQDAFMSDRWSLNKDNRERLADLQAGAALQHCCVLAEEVVAAHLRDAEFTGRLVARALVEAWLIGMYLHLGGSEAQEAVAAAYINSLTKMHSASTEHDRRLAEARADVARRNTKIQADNLGKRDWNRRNPDLPPREELPLLPEPIETELGFDLGALLDQYDDVELTEIKFSELPKKLRDLSRAQGDDQTYEAIYLLVYRGLSTIGAHPTQIVLESYMDVTEGGSQFGRVRPRTNLASIEEANLHTALLLISYLSTKVLGRRGSPCPKAESVLALYEATVDENPSLEVEAGTAEHRTPGNDQGES